MSLNIRQDHKFNAEEIQFLKERGRLEEIKENQRLERENAFTKKAKKSKDDDVLHLDKDIYDHVVKMSLNDLQMELRKVHIRPIGQEPDLRTALAEYLQDERDEGRLPIIVAEKPAAAEKPATKPAAK